LIGLIFCTPFYESDSWRYNFVIACSVALGSTNFRYRSVSHAKILINSKLITFFSSKAGLRYFRIKLVSFFRTYQQFQFNLQLVDWSSISIFITAVIAQYMPNQLIVILLCHYFPFAWAKSSNIKDLVIHDAMHFNGIKNQPIAFNNEAECPLQGSNFNKALYRKRPRLLLAAGGFFTFNSHGRFYNAICFKGCSVATILQL